MTALGAVGVVLQLLIVVTLSPLLTGMMRQLRARLEGRAGAGIGQPWRDLRKLMRKRPVAPHGTTEVFRTAPVVLVATCLVVAAVAPFVTTANRSATGSSRDAVVTNGATAATTRHVVTSTSGAVRNTSVVPCGATGRLRSSLRRSRHGCPIPAPARPSILARSCRIIPVSSGDRATTISSCRTTAATPSPVTGSPPAG